MRFRHQYPATRFFSISTLLTLFFFTSLFTSHSALAACACMCVDGVGADVCTGFIQTPTPGGCADTQCGPVDPPPEDPLTTPPDPIPPPNDPPVNTYDPPVEGAFDCRDRNIWRPDLNKYKVYKVCRKHRRHHDGDQEKHGKSRKHRKSEKHRYQRDDGDHVRKSRKSRKSRRKHHDDDGDG